LFSFSFLEYKDRVNVTVFEQEKAVQINLYNLQYSDDGEYKCNVLIVEGLKSFIGSSKLEIISKFFFF